MGETETEMISIIIPAKNEAIAIGDTIRGIVRLFPDAEVLVVNDGSTDETAAIAEGAGAKVLHQPYSKGNGAAIKAGLRIASNDIVVCMDGDGQHRPEDIILLLEKLEAGYDMVVGARSQEGQAGLHRSLANGFYNAFASLAIR
jgi:glycosyltransferase involved in cell wall biosynthesis